SQAVASDVDKIEEAFRRQTGVIEERTGTMERALSLGVENVRQVLEKSAVTVAGALRDKVLEVTTTLSDQASDAFAEADKRVADRAEQTTSALFARVEDIAKAFNEADGQIAARTEATSSALLARGEEVASLMTGRAGEIARVMDE